jgi:hypothetical protein
MGPGQYENNVGISQPVLIPINPILFLRTRAIASSGRSQPVSSVSQQHRQAAYVPGSGWSRLSRPEGSAVWRAHTPSAIPVARLN